MKKVICILFVLTAFAKINAQEPPVATLLESAEKATQRYVDSFKNLIAEETKTILTFKKDQSVGDKKVIKSNFIVYQLEKTQGLSEFRMVFEYNNEKVSHKNEDVSSFFEKIAGSDNASDVFQKIRNESVRFDGVYVVWGITLRKNFLLQENIRKLFDYKITGKEKFNDRDVYVVEYRQKDYSPFILVNPVRSEWQKDGSRLQFDTILSEKLRPTNPRLNGKIWIDAENGETWKNEYQVTIQPAILEKPIVTCESYSEYQPSRFEIAVPKVIMVTTYRTFGLPGKDLTVSKFASTTLSYSNFSRISSETRDYKENKNKN